MKKPSQIGNLKPKIIIVGAGPAGTSLAIRLAKQNFKVTLIEREKFPRHKLCGEFISPECREHFRELGVLDEMYFRGGDKITETMFYSENGNNVSIPSEWFGRNLDGALGLSRAEMDFRLMEKAKELGVVILEETSVVRLLFDEGKVCGVKVRNSIGESDEIVSGLTIDATGRAKVLSKLAVKQTSNFRFQISDRKKDLVKKKVLDFRRQPTGKKRVIEKKKFLGFRFQRVFKFTRKDSNIRNPQSVIRNRLVGFKTHLKNVSMPEGRCEIYFFRGGYGGLNYVEDGVANHCFLIKADVVKEFKGDVDRILEEVIFQNLRAKEMLQDAEKRFDWLAVSVDGFGVQDLNPAKNLFSVGDAGAFIDPFTGSGILMAFESSRVLANVIVEKQLEIEHLADEYKSLHRAKFQNRLRICSIMRRLSFVPKFAQIAIYILSLSKTAREILARSTRQTEAKKA